MDMGYMIVATSENDEHTYYYHGKDKKGVPIFYGFLNNKNTKVYPRVFSSDAQAIEVAEGIKGYIENSMFKSLKVQVWSEENVNYRVSLI